MPTTWQGPYVRVISWLSLATTVAAFVAALATWSTITAAATFAVILFTPGWAIVAALRIPGWALRVAVAVALSLGFCSTIATAMVTSRLWHPFAAMCAVEIVTIFALAWLILRDIRRSVDLRLPLTPRLGRHV